ncbi:Gfo/Idh/MocA family oxidoreductase [Streptantibioticus rubrisoli]|uniref:Gfo/Idh/MocA family oxidoreductase n=1 Tax=Streptantibioticus rubrisoli TaxID=1387313 RepID=A0ABT1PCQ5_9ACTN|nr:Gfo/Idh/MocA family oxidoreductase [Streptantibioticus rubrisoli]MCQ4043124.1 Gfo/Idh/MocA family oxidoreductase [Streptantibioticus rubrisoli]
MRIGLVGTGRIGSFHAEALRALPTVSELVVADADPARAVEVAARVGARATGSVDGLFACGVDAVVIASATSAHAELITRAARAGLPAYCEKPIALDLAGTLRALHAVEAAGTMLQMGFQRRFDAGYLAARAAYRDGRLGRVHTIRAVTSDPAPPPPEFLPLSGGLIRDCLVHDFDAVRWLTGREVVEVFARGSAGGAAFFREAGDVDTAAALLTLDDGTLVTATATRYNGAGYDVRMELSGEREQFVVGLDDRTPFTSAEPGGPAGPERPWTGFLERFESAYRAELAAFVEAAAGRAANPCSGREALHALLVAEACELSRLEGRPVQLEEIAKQL